MVNIFLSTILPWILIIFSALAVIASIFILYIIIAEDGTSEKFLMFLFTACLSQSGMLLWLGIKSLLINYPTELNLWSYIGAYVFIFLSPLIVMWTIDGSEVGAVLFPSFSTSLGVLLYSFTLPEISFIYGLKFLLIFQYLANIIILTLLIFVIEIIVAKIFYKPRRFVSTTITADTETANIEEIKENINSEVKEQDTSQEITDEELSTVEIEEKSNPSIDVPSNKETARRDNLESRSEQAEEIINRRRFERIVDTYSEIKLETMAQLLEIDQTKLQLWILDNPSDFGITIKQDLVFIDKGKVGDAIDELFERYTKAEKDKIGKI
ncbi:MAG: AEC family transporter [Candidatus Heimdallarchaeota archaeon]|nr:AEC family transporter [Candidatus Heimdallarchaeota archaeon]